LLLIERGERHFDAGTRVFSNYRDLGVRNGTIGSVTEVEAGYDADCT
jgi:hypothetical protein